MIKTTIIENKNFNYIPKRNMLGRNLVKLFKQQVTSSADTKGLHLKKDFTIKPLLGHEIIRTDGKKVEKLTKNHIGAVDDTTKEAVMVMTRTEKGPRGETNPHITNNLMKSNKLAHPQGHGQHVAQMKTPLKFQKVNTVKNKEINEYFNKNQKKLQQEHDTIVQDNKAKNVNYTSAEFKTKNSISGATNNVTGNSNVQNNPTVSINNNNIIP